MMQYTPEGVAFSKSLIFRLFIIFIIQIIEGGRSIANSNESLLDERPDNNANFFTRTTIDVSGILVKKAQEDSFVSMVSSFLI